MISKVTLHKSFAKRVGSKNQRTFVFKPGVNLLVGSNGSGKSSLIQAILLHCNLSSNYESKQMKAQKAEVTVISSPINVSKYDFEKDNVRTLSYFGKDTALQLASMRLSHGETNNIILQGLAASKQVEQQLVILDEPDQALDLTSIQRLFTILKECKAPQMIVSAHNPLLVLLGRKDFNIIELEKGYVNKVYEAVQKTL